MKKLYGTRKHGVMAHNGEVGGGGSGGGEGIVYIDIDVSEVVYPSEEASPSQDSYAYNFDLVDQIVTSVKEAFEADKEVVIRAWNNYANDDKELYSEHPDIVFIYRIQGSAQESGSTVYLSFSSPYIQWNETTSKNEVATGIIGIGTVKDGDHYYIEFDNSGLYYTRERVTH